MDIRAYQAAARATAIYPRNNQLNYDANYATLGLCSEAGEVAGKVKKIMRDKGGHWTLADREELEKELGDVLWYLAAVASDLGLDLGVITQINLDKLQDRAERGVLGGSGDNR